MIITLNNYLGDKVKQTEMTSSCSDIFGGASNYQLNFYIEKL